MGHHAQSMTFDHNGENWDGGHHSNNGKQVYAPHHDIAHDNIVVDQVEEKILEKLLFSKVQENVRRRF